MQAGTALARLGPALERELIFLRRRPVTLPFTRKKWEQTRTTRSAQRPQQDVARGRDETRSAATYRVHAGGEVRVDEEEEEEEEEQVGADHVQGESEP